MESPNMEHVEDKKKVHKAIKIDDFMPEQH